VQIIEAKAESAVLDAGGRPAYHLRAGRQYVVHDCEAARGLQAQAVTLVQGLDRLLPRYNRQPLGRQRVLVPFIGRGGDALVMAACVAALNAQYPDVRVDAACPDGPREVLSTTPVFDRLLPYPVPAEELTQYDHYMCLEEVEAVPDARFRSLADVFHRCLGTPRPTCPAPIVIPHAWRAAWHWPRREKPRVALHAGLPPNIRAYPPDLSHRLAGLLARAGIEVYLVGKFDPRCDFSTPSYPVGVLDLVGRTTTTLDLAAALQQMDAVITCDGLPLHLAGAMKLPTLALFTATDAVLAADYPSVRALQSAAPCSPCRIAVGACPFGHERCIAHRDPSLSPEHIAEQVEQLLHRRAPVVRST